MGKEYKIKLSSVLSLDESKEKDLIDQLESLKGSHRLGDFISACVRICYDNPELFKEAGYTNGTFSMRLTKNRENFFSDLESELDELRNKVNKVYDMANKVYMLALFGKKQLGMEDKALNLLQTTFVLQRQVDELSTIFGVSSIKNIWDSNRLSEISKKADEVLEYIIDAHSNLIEEIKTVYIERNSTVTTQVNIDKNIETTGQSGNNTLRSIDESARVKESTKSNINTTNHSEAKIETEAVKLEDTDFEDNADWSMLDKFVGL